MNIITWVAFGAIAGIVANLIDPSPSRGGILGAVILGILGALVGGFISNLLFGITISGFDLTSFAIAVAGAVALLIFGRVLARR